MISENLQHVRNTIPSEVLLVAVSKTYGIAEIMEAYRAGQRHFGENKVQELESKVGDLPEDIQWHLIGHLQTNKVKYIAPYVSLVHSVDSFKLLKEINKQAKKHDRVIDCLLQFHISGESTKFGMNFEEAESILESREFVELQNVNVVGVMGMAGNTEDEAVIRSEFAELRNIFFILKSHFFKFNDAFRHISMGMSGDYELAIEEGSTMVRIGSAIFGARNYN